LPFDAQHISRADLPATWNDALHAPLGLSARDASSP
jgi:hypothetical protein